MIDFAIFSLFLVISVALCVFGLFGGKNSLGVLTLVGASLMVMFAGELGQDPNIVVGYNGGTALTYALTGTEILGIGTVGFVLLLWGALKIAGHT